MDAIQVQDAVVAQKWTLTPRFILLGQGVVETAHGAGARGDSQQFFSDIPDFMRACAADKHLRQRFCYLGFIPAIPLKDLSMELPCTITGY